MTSSEWASWVQAIGSIAAICTAVWIAWRADNRAERSAIASAVLIAAELRRLLAALIDVCERQYNQQIAESIQAELREVLHLGRSIKPGALPDGGASNLLRALAVGARVDLELDRLVGQGHPNWHNFKGVFERLRVELLSG